MAGISNHQLLSSDRKRTITCKTHRIKLSGKRRKFKVAKKSSRVQLSIEMMFI